MKEINSDYMSVSTRRPRRFFDLRAGCFVYDEKSCSFIIGTTQGGEYCNDKLYGASFPGTMEDLGAAIRRSDSTSAPIMKDLFSAVGLVSLLSDSLRVETYSMEDPIPDYLRPIYYTDSSFPRLCVMAALLTDERLAELSAAI